MHYIELEQRECIRIANDYIRKATKHSITDAHDLDKLIDALRPVAIRLKQLNSEATVLRKQMENSAKKD